MGRLLYRTQLKQRSTPPAAQGADSGQTGWQTVRVLEFKELGNNGRGLEQLTRELLLELDFRPQWSGVGPDGGRDLLFDELGSPALGGKPRKWLVSCKDYAVSGNAVGTSDVDGVLEAVAQHGAQGFLLVCTTYPSSGAVERLRALETNSGDKFVAHVWDGVTT